jgi:hypothetical protein
LAISGFLAIVHGVCHEALAAATRQICMLVPASLS